MDWELPYTIRNILKHRCLKWACMVHLSTWNTSYGWEKGHESKYQFDSRSLKVTNRFDLLVFKWRATYYWKALDEGYIFAFNLTSIKGFHKKLWAYKVAGVPISRILRLSTWESWERWHLGVAPMANHREYYKREGGGFPQVWIVVNLVSPCMVMVCPCTKSAPTIH